MRRRGGGSRDRREQQPRDGDPLFTRALDQPTIMRPDGFYDENGHWWRIFPPLNMSGGSPDW